MEEYEQLGLFEEEFPKYQINKPIRLITTFSGIGSQEMALKRLGVDFDIYKAVEFDEFAMKSYNSIHGTNFPTLDIRDIHAADLEIVDRDKYCYILFYSWPCFTADTLILTNSGYKKIVNVKTGDYVLTHTNKWQKVVAFYDNGEKQIYKLHAMPIDTLECTENHRFYIREMYRTYPRLPNGKRGAIRHFKEPVWKECKDLTKKDYIGIAINQKSELPKWEGIEIEWDGRNRLEVKNIISSLLDKPEFWWLMGYYLGDGWERTQGGITLAANDNKLNRLKPILEELKFNYCVVKEQTVYKVHIPLKELSAYIQIFGKYAYGKKVPMEVLNLPVDLLKAFLDGYFAADGSISKGKYRATSVSKELIYGIAQAVAKVYKTPYSIYKSHRSDTCVIEGRTVNQRDTYSIAFKINKCKQDKAFYEDGYIWCPIYSIDKSDIQNVYDIEVDEDHSFTANGVIVHNCTDLSLAGKQAGMEEGSGTRSSLLWEVKRLIEECKDNLPDVLISENVVQCHSDKNISAFNRWIDFLTSLGYSSFCNDLNAKDFGVPQNRDRCFLVSILGKYDFQFPKTIPLEKVMADVLEEEVDEKFFISSEKADKLIEQLIRDGKLED